MAVVERARLEAASLELLRQLKRFVPRWHRFPVRFLTT
jgi:hypothetical protein